MVLFPWGSPAMGFLPGEGLPYAIISAGTISHLFPYYEICVGEIYHRGGTLPYGIVSPPGEVLKFNFFRGKFAIWYSFRGTFAIWYNFRGGGVRGGGHRRALRPQ